MHTLHSPQQPSFNLNSKSPKPNLNLNPKPSPPLPVLPLLTLGLPTTCSVICRTSLIILPKRQLSPAQTTKNSSQIAWASYPSLLGSRSHYLLSTYLNLSTISCPYGVSPS